MAEQKQPFRLRLPWFAPQRTTPQPQPQRPRPMSERSQQPSQWSTAIPTQRPAFRRAGIAPTQPPSQSQPPPKAEPQSSSPSSSSAATEATKSSPSVPITRATSPSPAKSQPPPKAEPQSPAPSSSSVAIEVTKSSQSVPVTKATSPSPAKFQPPPKAEPQSPPPSSSSAATEATKSSQSVPVTKPTSPSPGNTRSPKTTSQSASSSFNATSKPPPPASATTNYQKDTSQSSSSPSIATTKPQSPSRATTESPKANSQAAVSAIATAPKQVSPSSPATSSRTDISQSASSPSSTTAKLPSPPREAIESQKAASPLASSPSSDTAKPPSPSPAAAEPRVSSQTVSPSQPRTQSRATSTALSPSIGNSKSKASSLPLSPSLSASQTRLELQKSSQPSEVSSASQKANQHEPESTGIVTQSPSSHDKSQAINQDSSSASLTSTQTQQSSPQEEPKTSASQAPSQVSEPKFKITSETIEKPDSQDDAMERNHIKVSSPVEGIASREATDEHARSIDIDQKPPSKAERDTKEIEDVKEKVQEIPKEEKTNKATYEEEPMQKTIIEAPSTRRDTEKTHNVARKAPRMQQKQETSESEETVATTSYMGKQIKTVIPLKATEGSTSTSLQKPFSLTEEEAPRQREIKEDISKLVRAVTTGPQLDGKDVTVITLSGDNRGALMRLSSEAAKNEGSVHIHRGYKTDPDESPKSTTGGEVRTNRKRLTEQMASTPAAYVNSNVQSVNNSIVLEASVKKRSPGVYLSYTQNTQEAIKSNGKSKSVQNRKAEFIPTPSEKLTHQPVVRRRCLRGLFMEPSDSEPDNPNKPRRHGCRYSCGKTSKDKEIM